MFKKPQTTNLGTKAPTTNLGAKAPSTSFASQKAEKKKAFNLLRQTPLKLATTQLEYFLEGLWQHWFVLKGDDMTIKLTSEQVTEMGKMWGDSFFARLTLDDVFTRFKREEILAQFNPKERLAGLKSQELEELEDYIKKLKKKG
jgi:hypothetical protein